MKKLLTLMMTIILMVPQAEICPRPLAKSALRPMSTGGYLQINEMANPNVTHDFMNDNPCPLKVLLINPIDEFVGTGSGSKIGRDYFIPLGLASIAASLREYTNQSGISLDLHVIDAPTLNYDFERTISAIRDFHPDILCISVLTPSVNVATELAKRTKIIYPEVITVLGGIHPTIDPDIIRKRESVDIIVKEQGEIIITRIIEAFLNSEGDRQLFSKQLEGIPGIVFKDSGGSIIDTGISKPIDLDSLPIPAYDLFPLERYRWRGVPTVSVESHRGCPYRCTFCVVPSFSQRGVKKRSPENFVDLLEHVNKALGFRYAYNVSDNFTLDFEYVAEIARLIDERGLQISLEVYVRANDIVRNPLIVQELRKAGVKTVFLGVESGDEDILSSYNKDITLKEVEAAIELLHKEGIVVITGFLIGGIDDNEETIQRSIEFANRLKEKAPHILHLAIATPYPGTTLNRQAEELGLIEDRNLRNYGGHGKVIMRTRFLNRSRVQQLYEEFLLDFYTPEYIELLRGLLDHYRVASGFIEEVEKLRGMKAQKTEGEWPRDWDDIIIAIDIAA